MLNADYAEGFVSGFQTGEDPAHLKASSCCKHYAGYSLESWSPKGPDDPKPVTRHDCKCSRSLCVFFEVFQTEAAAQSTRSSAHRTWLTPTCRPSCPAPTEATPRA